MTLPTAWGVGGSESPALGSTPDMSTDPLPDLELKRADRRAANGRSLGHPVQPRRRRARPVHVRERVAARRGRTHSQRLHGRRRSGRWVVTASAEEAKQFLGPWADELLTFADPDRAVRQGSRRRRRCRRSCTSTWRVRSTPSPKAGIPPRGAKWRPTCPGSSTGPNPSSPARKHPPRTRAPHGLNRSSVLASKVRISALVDARTNRGVRSRGGRLRSCRGRRGRGRALRRT